MQHLVDHETDPVALERAYRSAPDEFQKALQAAFARHPESPVFQVWHARLAFEPPSPAGVVERLELRRIVWVAALVLLAGTLAKLPDLLSGLGLTLPQERYYTRNTGFFVLPLLAAYFLYHFERSRRMWIALAGFAAGACLYVNVLPEATADTVVLALLHVPFVLWGLLGLAYVGSYRHEADARLRFLRYNGEMLIYTALILLAGGLLSGLTIALFGLIDLDIAEVYMENVGVYGLAGAPIVATLLATTRYGVSQRIAPVIARIFGPLALVALVVYLGAFLLRGANPAEDREMLVVLNGVLLAVLALIVFSISEQQPASRFTLYVGVGLLAVAVALDLIALVAIVSRLTDGLTPNRLAVLGANVLILVHLALLLYRYTRLLAGKETLAAVEATVTGYLPLYVGWAALVTFGFPLLFGFA